MHPYVSNMAQQHLDFGASQSIVVIDEHDIARFGVATVLASRTDLRLVGEAADLTEGLRVIDSARPDLAITDIGPTGAATVERVKALIAAQAPRPVLVFSGHDELEYGARILDAGARGYLMKDHACTDLVAACHSVLAGHTWLSPRLRAALLNRHMRRNSGACVRLTTPTLSERDSQLLACLGHGLTTKEIASLLGLGIRMVDAHRARLKSKLGLRTGAELIAYASAGR